MTLLPTSYTALAVLDGWTFEREIKEEVAEFDPTKKKIEWCWIAVSPEGKRYGRAVFEHCADDICEIQLAKARMRSLLANNFEDTIQRLLQVK